MLIFDLNQYIYHILVIGMYVVDFSGVKMFATVPRTVWLSLVELADISDGARFVK